MDIQQSSIRISTYSSKVNSLDQKKMVTEYNMRMMEGLSFRELSDRITMTGGVELLTILDSLEKVSLMAMEFFLIPLPITKDFSVEDFLVEKASILEEKR